MQKTAIFILLLVWAVLLNSQIVSNFTNGLENWAVEGDSDYEWSSTLGNSGGRFEKKCIYYSIYL